MGNFTLSCHALGQNNFKIAPTWLTFTITTYPLISVHNIYLNLESVHDIYLALKIYIIFMENKGKAYYISVAISSTVFRSFLKLYSHNLNYPRISRNQEICSVCSWTQSVNFSKVLFYYDLLSTLGGRPKSFWCSENIWLGNKMLMFPCWGNLQFNFRIFLNPFLCEQGSSHSLFLKKEKR